MLKSLKEKIFNGKNITKEEAATLVNADLSSLCNAANEIRKHFCDNGFDICSIINGKSGRCSENCKYCAQSLHYKVPIEEYPLLNAKQMIDEAKYNSDRGILRYSVVTSGKRMTDDEIDKMCNSYREIAKNTTILMCGSHGLLNYEQFLKLKEAGLCRYHNNLETSRRFFSSVCTTHTYDDKIETIKAAQKAGLTVCSGGIMGLGETMEDRIDMAFDLKALGINSIPLNILNPIKGTPFENNPLLKTDEIYRIVAIYRFILPKATIRMAGGRGLMTDKGRAVFKSGANAAISGDMLTTSGISISEDMKMIKELGFEVKLL